MSKNIPNFAVRLKELRPARRLTFPVGMPSCGKFFLLFLKKMLKYLANKQMFINFASSNRS